MNINLTKISLAFLFTTSCLTQTTYGMRLDEKESAKECYKSNPHFFDQELNKELKRIREGDFKETKDCATLAKDSSGAYLQYYSSYTILEHIKWKSPKVFCKSYFSHTNMNDIKWSIKDNPYVKISYYFCDSWTALKSKKTEDYGPQDAGYNSQLLFEKLDDAMKNIGRKYFHLKLKFEEVGISPKEKDWKAINYLYEKGYDIDKVTIKACRKGMKTSLHWDSCTSFNDLPEWINLFKQIANLGESKPKDHHTYFFRQLIQNKISLSEEIIDKVMDITESTFREVPIKEKLKMLTVSEENYVPYSKKATEWFKDKYKTEPTPQDLSVAKHIMRQKGLKLTPSSFEAAKVLMTGEKKIIPWPTKVEIEIAECWMANSKQAVTWYHIEAGRHLLKVGFPEIKFPELKAAWYLMEPLGYRHFIYMVSKLRIEATAYLMNLENFKQREEPQEDQN